MLIIPAIDIQGGRCVRLRQGDFASETVYADDPVAVAEHWAVQGAPRLHLVDLDGARTGRPQNLQTVRRIVERVPVPCQLGGGLRSEGDIRAAFACGVQWCVIGTQALLTPGWFAALCQAFPQRLWLGVDVRDGLVATHGWQQTISQTAEDVLAQFVSWPIAGFIVTDIRRDGMLAGVNVEWLQHLVRQTQLPIIASGGVSSLQDIARLCQVGVAGCIVGKSLYERKLDLRQALAWAAAQSHGDRR
ncbi:1-(5-phosphoribosyl)-5-[(5-phosphoribosylamino) methylideneamino] imidazole-4-carboxamide isomerase [bacterium HR36]|nr:1-(5-phosphoribosyl)-5-[(5-phosphoribosylamino) methylideneamino] imidazole-4-carboxamide isomerase [bacterium HR36]